MDQYPVDILKIFILNVGIGIIARHREDKKDGEILVTVSHSTVAGHHLLLSVNAVIRRIRKRLFQLAAFSFTNCQSFL